MQAAQIPARFPIPFADGATAGFIRPIPEASQIGIESGAASLTDGFPPDTFTPVAAGGVPPFGQDFNGLLNQMTLWNQWQAAGGPVKYDATFAAAIGGYPAGAVLSSATAGGYFWISGADDNTSDPDAGGANWNAFSFSGGTTGDTKWRPTSEVLVTSGWVIANGTTIGNPSSNASQYANALTSALFAWVWTNFSNTQCPVLTSGSVPTTRGASAAADYAANRQITLPDLRGSGVFGLDTMGTASAGRLTNVPATIGNATTPGSILGENLHALIIAELAAHAHAVSIVDPGHTHNVKYTQATVPVFEGAGAVVTAIQSIGAITGTNAAASNTTGISASDSTIGSGTAHNTVPRVMLGTWYIKL